MIDADAHQMMRDSAILVNTSRGGLIDTHALIDALRQRKFAGVGGLDVYETEDNQIFEDYSDDVLRSVVVPVLLSFPNVVITSHQAFFYPHLRCKYCHNYDGNARAFARGEKLVNLGIKAECRLTVIRNPDYNSESISRIIAAVREETTALEKTLHCLPKA